MVWTEIQEPNNEIPYTHVTSITPLGVIVIDWKSWKEQPDYDVSHGNEQIGTAYSLEDAKTIASEYMKSVVSSLIEYATNHLTDGHADPQETDGIPKR